MRVTTLSQSHGDARYTFCPNLFNPVMAPNEHLLDNFLASKETRNLGADILRLAQVKTGPGSGRELRELKVGLPAAAILVACER